MVPIRVGAVGGLGGGGVILVWGWINCCVFLREDWKWSESNSLKKK